MVARFLQEWVGAPEIPRWNDGQQNQQFPASRYLGAHLPIYFVPDVLWLARMSGVGCPLLYMDMGLADCAFGLPRKREIASAHLGQIPQYHHV